MKLAIFIHNLVITGFENTASGLLPAMTGCMAWRVHAARASVVCHCCIYNCTLSARRHVTMTSQ